MITRRCDRKRATQYALFTAMIDWQSGADFTILCSGSTNLGWSGYFFVSTMIPFVWWAVSRRRAPLSFMDPVIITDTSSVS